MTENYEYIQMLANRDVVLLKKKGEAYGSSWRKRGGVGAFMMLSRKWDRIENMCQEGKYDIFEVGSDDTPGGILDDIQDLRCYLLLVESHIINECMGRQGRVTGSYVNQDPDLKRPMPEIPSVKVPPMGYGPVRAG